MRPKLLLYTIASVLPLYGISQSANLDINNISAGIYADGKLFNDTSFTNTQFEYPKGAGTHCAFGSNLWISGIDAGSNLHLAAQTYNQSGVDFFQGPVMDSSSYSTAQDAAWNKVWKINKTTIDSFKLGQFGSSVPQVIADWPGNGNTALGQAAQLAPYFDNNNNGIYEPASGDYPIIKGDQSVFFIFNDDRAPHTESGGQKLGVEIHGMAYAFSCADSALQNSIFFHYDIYNRSSNNYTGVKIGSWTDFDLGGHLDDLVGSDSLLNVHYVYNGTVNDAAGNGPFYGSQPPALGVVKLGPALSGDGFQYFSNDFSAMGNPTVDTAFANYLNGKWIDGQPVTYGGNGKGGSVSTSFMFTGDPVVPSGWVDSTPNDRRGLGVYGPYNLPSGGKVTLDLAFVVGRDFGGTNLTSVNVMKQRAMDVKTAFTNDSTACGTKFSTVGFEEEKMSEGNIVAIYPNPTRDRLHLNLDLKGERALVQLFDLKGALVMEDVVIGDKQVLQMEDVEKGLYLLKVTTNRIVETQRVVKQ